MNVGVDDIKDIVRPKSKTQARSKNHDNEEKYDISIENAEDNTNEADYNTNY